MLRNAANPREKASCPLGLSRGNVVASPMAIARAFSLRVECMGKRSGLITDRGLSSVIEAAIACAQISHIASPFIVRYSSEPLL